jgi:hypothetical protein
MSKFSAMASSNPFNVPTFNPRTFSAASAGDRDFSAASEGHQEPDWEKYDLQYFLKGALAGGICCSLTHGALCPVDVVKTKIQLEPEVYNKGMVSGFRQVIAADGTVLVIYLKAKMVCSRMHVLYHVCLH